MLPVSSGACNECHDLAAIAARSAGDAMPAFFRDADGGIGALSPGRAWPFYFRLHPSLHGRHGRIGRFFMNVMLASSGYPCTVLPLDRSGAYMAAVQEARMRQNMAPFAQLRGQLVEEGDARPAGGKSAKR